MKRKVFSILSWLLVLAIVVPVTGSASAQAGDLGASTNETPSLWFVELSSAPTADGTSPSTVKAEKSAFRSNAKKVGLVYTERYAFDTLWNGLSISMNVSQLDKLERISGVKNIYPVGTTPIPETSVLSDPELYTSLAMIGADIAHSEMGYTGAGIKVGVIDTGIDYDHPDLGGDGVTRQNSSVFPTGRVITGYDFVGDAYNADSAATSTPNPDPYPDDCAGHGTHVAGIIGANGAVVGVAPQVSFAAYRIFGCAGSANDDVILLAMERALTDHMNVINMSLGSAFTWPQYPLGQAGDRLTNKGVVVVASIGNSGASGLYSAGAPGLGNKVIGVASFDNVGIVLPYFTISPDATQIGYIVAAAAPLPPTSGSFPMARTGTVSSTADACTALPAGSLTGQVALIRRGTCGFYQKSRNAQLAGAVGVVLYNNAPTNVGFFNPTVAGSPAVTIPVVAVSDTEGALIDSRLASGSVDMTWTDQLGSFPNATGNLISSFSSYGLSPDLALKPDIGAPGGFIWSTYPLELGGHTSLSGTSMASPHVAGSVALYLQAHPGTSAQDIRDILQNSADPRPRTLTSSALDNVHRQGAGLLDVDDAILATTLIKPGKISAGEGQAGPFIQTLTLRNTGGSDVTYDLSYVNALSTGGVITPSFTTSNASVSFSAPSVTVPAGATATVSATINPATTPVNGQYGGYIVFTQQGSGEVYRVSFAGFVGDYQGIQVLTSGGVGFPLLGQTADGVHFDLASPGHVFTLEGFDDPYFLVHFEHQARLFRVDIFAQSGKDWHRAFNEEYMTRNATSTGFFAFPFDGATFVGNKTYTVPDGTYYAVISVLKANGDPNNPAHWETWTSPTFVIDRP